MIELKYKVGFSDCDPAGIVFYSKIFEFCHKVYEELIYSFGIEENYWSNQTYTVPIISASGRYLKPIKYYEEIIIRLFIKEIKNSSFESYYEVYKGKELSAVVNTIHVFISPENWNKIEIPFHIKNKLAMHIMKTETQ